MYKQKRVLSVERVETVNVANGETFESLSSVYLLTT